MRFTFVILLFCGLGADAQMIIKAHANYRPYAVAVAQNLLLDDYPNAAAAYSLRKLDKDYTGSCIRVRRVNDNAEQDIGFVSNYLDTVSLKTFVTTNESRITTWYDQSGNARNATQTTAANQPRIVNAGTVERRSGDISLVYDGTNDFLEAASTSGLTISPTSFYAVSSRGNTADAIRTVFATGILGAERGYGIFYSLTEAPTLTQDRLYNQVRFQTGSQISGRGDYTNTINTNNLFFSTVTTTSNNTWYNGGNNASETYSYTNNTTTGNITIGVRASPLSANPYIFYLNGTTSEIVIWQSNQSSNRTGIENNINDYYNIYWNGDFAGLLDSFPSSAAAYSLRNLDKDYTGPLVRVRRSNDNAEQDIFGDYYGNLDTVGLKNFVGANSGFVTTWYDQSGNARNATQTTTTQQVRVVNAGTVDRRNGKVTMVFDGSNDNFNTTYDGLDLATGDTLRAYAVVTPRVVNTTMEIMTKFDATAVASTEDGWFFRLTTTSKLQFLGVKDGNYPATSVISSDNMVANTQYLLHLFAPAGGLTGGTDLYRNNSLLTVTRSGAINATLDNTTYPIRIGYQRWQGANYFFWDGSMQEIILYGTATGTDRTGISNNINSHYGIY